jgi:hypothetical protein
VALWQKTVFQGVLNILQHLYGHASPFWRRYARSRRGRLGGLARAAVELHLTTSSISHELRRLEKNLGTRLLERTTAVAASESYRPAPDYCPPPAAACRLTRKGVDSAAIKSRCAGSPMRTGPHCPRVSSLAGAGPTW